MFDPTKYDDNFSNDTATVLPAGEYVVKIVYAGKRQSKSGTPGVNLKFQVLDGEFKGKSFFITFWISEKAAWRLAKFMKSWRFAQPFDENDPEELNRVFWGKMGHIRITYSNRDGFERNDFQAGWPLSEGEQIKYSQGISVNETVEEDPFAGSVQGNMPSTFEEPQYSMTDETGGEGQVQVEDEPFLESADSVPVQGDDPFGW